MEVKDLHLTMSKKATKQLAYVQMSSMMRVNTQYILGVCVKKVDTSHKA